MEAVQVFEGDGVDHYKPKAKPLDLRTFCEVKILGRDISENATVEVNENRNPWTIRIVCGGGISGAGAICDFLTEMYEEARRPTIGNPTYKFDFTFRGRVARGCFIKECATEMNMNGDEFNHFEIIADTLQ